MKALDFFCGAGGLTRGLIDAGIDVIAGYDLDEKCRATYEYNNPNTKFVHADIRSLTSADILLRFQSHDTEEDILFAACAPCQPFSSQRKPYTTSRGAQLLKEFSRLVESMQPTFVLIENVPGMARVQGFSTYRRFLKTLKSNDYRYDWKVLDAKHFGVPQNRRRLVLIANKKGPITLPQPTFGENLRPFSTVRETIDHFPQIGAGETHTHVPNHVAASVSPLNLNRLRKTPHDGGDRRAWPQSIWLNCHKGPYSGHTDAYGRLSWDKPAPTLTGRCNSLSNGRYGHPDQDRAISLREAASLQSFPKNYIFFGSNKHIAMQIGNAVPVKLAKRLGEHILNTSRDLEPNHRT